MAQWPILSMIIFLPLVGVAAMMFLRDKEQSMALNAKRTALAVSIAVFVLTLFLWLGFDNSAQGFQYQQKLVWFPNTSLAYHVGIDGISLSFMLLTTFLVPICVLASWHSIQTNVKYYMVSFLVLETLMLGTFAALNTILFYVFFEAVLIPMFIIIGIWGGKNKIYAAFKFFLYTLLGSILMLIALIVMGYYAGTTDIPELMQYDFPFSLQKWLWLAFFASFAVKMPMWPVHTWLPDAHVEAPTAGSVILAGVLLKMGGYGFIRFSLPMLPDASVYFAPMVFVLSVIAVIYTSLVALAQTDMKKLIAYSSVAHMGFVTAGLFAGNPQGISGAMVQMLSHGLISAALFLCVGVVYDRIHSRDIAKYAGLVNNMPRYAFFFLFFTMASVGLPGTSGFVGEFLVLVGAFQASTIIGTLLASGMVLGATYALWLYRRVMYGKLLSGLADIRELDRREFLIFTAIGLLVLWMGIYPISFLDLFEVPVEFLVARMGGE
ncbi:MAG: NADH-quinone oxidoreductase subunit M [Alphaproteobacteria bacterium]|nr:NADH-quinone oxidoreductase subunit M [Alphaproteobacteria bacterium]